MATSPRSSSRQRMQSRVELVTQQELPPRRAALGGLRQGRKDLDRWLALATEGDEETTDPQAEGACRFDLSAAQWRLVRNAPLVGFLMVAGADGTVLPQEQRALVRALEEGRHSPCELFQEVCRDLYRRRNTLLALFGADTFEQEQLSAAYRLVSEKQGPEEAERFKACLLKLARRVARASGGWISSCGWVRGVERRALADLARALGRHQRP